MTELLPCPFCGGEAYEREHAFRNTHSWSMIICDDCGASVQRAGLDGTYDGAKQAAIAAWNTRAEMSYEDALILLDELGLSERTCRNTSGKNWWAFECSECGEMIEQGVPEYCPSCGAKVVGE